MKKIATLLLVCALFALSSYRDPSLEEQARQIHSQIVTLDSHNDTPLRFGQTDYDVRADNAQGCVDIPKMEQGGLDGAFFAAYIRQGARDDASNGQAQQKVLAILEKIHATIAANPDKLLLATTPDDAYAAKLAGKRAVFIGVENGYAIGRDVEMIDRFYDLGVRYITLVHSRNNDICDSATDSTAEHNGLSPFGRQVVARMNELGVMVDISHASEKSAFDAIALSPVPVIASHSCARAVCDNRRNMSDSLLVAMAAKGGVMQLCILNSYVKANAQNVTVSDAVDHIDHVVRLVGIDHVGIGTDFDGGGKLADCQTAADLQRITVELLRRGYSESDIEKIWGGNLLRVLSAVEGHANQRITQTQLQN